GPAEGIGACLRVALRVENLQQQADEVAVGRLQRPRPLQGPAGAVQITIWLTVQAFSEQRQRPGAARILFERPPRLDRTAPVATGLASSPSTTQVVAHALQPALVFERLARHVRLREAPRKPAPGGRADDQSEVAW